MDGFRWIVVIWFHMINVSTQRRGMIRRGSVSAMQFHNREILHFIGKLIGIQSEIEFFKEIFYWSFFSDELLFAKKSKVSTTEKHVRNNVCAYLMVNSVFWYVTLIALSVCNHRTAGRPPKSFVSEDTKRDNLYSNMINKIKYRKKCEPPYWKQIKTIVSFWPSR